MLIAHIHAHTHLEQSAVIMPSTRTSVEVISQDLMSSAIFFLFYFFYTNHVLALLNKYSQCALTLVNMAIGWDDKT